MQPKRAKGAILAESRKPLVVDEFDLPDALAPGQVLVKLHYTTICGAQINEIDAVKGPDKFLPHLLGHEASGTVIEIGPGVTTKRPNDHVVLHWRPSLGIQCVPPAYRWRGRTLNAGWVTTFNDYACVSENRMTVIDPDFNHKIAPLLGCAVITALGVINNDAKVKIGDSVIVMGAGGVGLNLVQCAQMAGAFPIVAVNVIDAKLALARKLGATDTVNAGAVPDLDAALRRIVGAAGADKVLETTGQKTVIEAAYDLTHADGSCILIGVPNEKVTIATLPLHFNKVLTGSHGGGSQPHIDIPRLIRLNKAGRMSFEGIITHEYRLDQIDEALALVRSGQAGRVLLNFD